jgi:hypothetical protein
LLKLYCLSVVLITGVFCDAAVRVGGGGGGPRVDLDGGTGGGFVDIVFRMSGFNPSCELFLLFGFIGGGGGPPLIGGGGALSPVDGRMLSLETGVGICSLDGGVGI